MSAKFSLRIKGTPPMHRLSNPNNKAEAAVARSNIKKKRKQLDDAILWCQENNVRGHSAVKSGLFLLVKNERTVNKRLDGKILNGTEKAYCSVLLPEEEETLVQYVINKNCCYQGISKAELTKLIINVLQLRDHLNKTMKGGRKYKPLSRAGKRVLSTKK